MFKHESNVNKNMEAAIQKVVSKVEILENDLKIIKNCLAEKDSKIAKLEEKILYFELKLNEMASLTDKFEKLNDTVKSSETNDILNDKIKDIEEIQTNLISESGKYDCNKCDFTTYYKRGLNIHKKKMHKVYSCTYCEEIFETVRDFKVHTYTHSYTITDRKVKCKNCGFESKTLNSMEVHVGWCREKDFECGLCDSGFSEKEDLEIHLRTCEMYECDSNSCLQRSKKLSDMKKHINENHENYTLLNHLKIDRKNEFEVTSTSHFLKDL